MHKQFDLIEMTTDSVSLSINKLENTGNLIFSKSTLYIYYTLIQLDLVLLTNCL